MKPKTIVVIFISLLLVSCMSLPSQVPTEAAKPTDTVLPATATITPKPTQIKVATFTPTETPIPTRTFAPVPSERPDDDEISGTYIFEHADESYCAVRADLQPFIPPYQEVVIELFCLRGPPSYSSGGLIQKVLLSNNLAVYSASEKYFDYIEDYTSAPCHIVFQFEKDIIEVTQLGLDFDCGFGHGVYADGVYKLIDPKPPVIGCLSIWNECAADYPLP
ncbi:MAG: hypothetical protein U0V02_07165 [Anaerolineales bacterium]